MINALYTILIFPIEQVIELGFVFICKIFNNPALAVIGVSFFVSTLTLPLYFMAEKIQHAERDIQYRMKNAVDNIKTVFTGDERYMRLNTYYRQQGYHPLYSLRSSISLIIQIPFFIAAYNFLSNLLLLQGQSFLFIKNLGTPDGILNGINILPVLMTLINIFSAIIYTRGLPIKDKIQLYGMAAIFLVLLYNSPSALVLYWTCNNLYSLIKNILQKTKNAKIIIYISACIISISGIIFLLFIHDGNLLNRLLIVFLLLNILILPLWKKFLQFIQRNISIKNTSLEYPNKTFFLSLTGIFLLLGLVIPSTLILTSVDEFSKLKPLISPFPYIGSTLLQSLGITVYIIAIFFLFSKKIKVPVTALLTVILMIFLINTYLFQMNYGHMDENLLFSNFQKPNNSFLIINIITMMFVFIFFLFLLLIKRKKIIFYIQSIIILSLFIIGISNIVNISHEYKNIKSENLQLSSSTDFVPFEKIFNFSKSGNNYLVIVLDRGVSGFIPYLFDEKPELLDTFSGFTYFPNTVGFGRFTIQSMHTIFGGYYYTPLEIQKRSDELFWDKYYSSMQVLPLIFSEKDIDVSVYNQSYMDNSLYDIYENINAGRYIGKYTNNYLNENNNKKLIKNSYKHLYDSLIRYSFLRCSPPILHEILYNKGGYLLINNYQGYTINILNHFSSLYYLSDITNITDDNKNYSTIVINDLPHQQAFFQAPEYIPEDKVTNFGNSPFSRDDYYHTMMAAFLQLKKWFDFLKENDVYNNTRIIITSDHGSNYANHPGKKIIPQDFKLKEKIRLSYYQSLLMVKDFNETEKLKTDNKFMTLADIPHITTEGLTDILINPFTGKEMLIEKENGVFITYTQKSALRSVLKYKYDIDKNEWFHVHTNIFERDNWSLAEVEY